MSQIREDFDYIVKVLERLVIFMSHKEYKEDMVYSLAVDGHDSDVGKKGIANLGIEGRDRRFNVKE